MSPAEDVDEFFRRMDEIASIPDEDIDQFLALRAKEKEASTSKALHQIAPMSGSRGSGFAYK